jgi:hypothetical protein
MNFQQQEQFYQMMTRLKSRAASTPANEKENETVTEVMNGLIVTRPAKKFEHLSTSETKESEPIITDLQTSKAGSGTKYYDMSLPSTGDQVFKCGIHDFETKNVTEFNRHVEDHGSKAASVSGTIKLQEILRFQRSNGRL